jgi:anti-sigma regulatory factor (Ser/Thr protein kinase)
VQSHDTTNGNGTFDQGDLGLHALVVTAESSHHPAGTELSARFTRGPAAAADARQALRALEQRLDPELLDDIRLLVSELVTNSIRHAPTGSRGEVGLDVSILDDRRLRVEVADPGSGFEPRPRTTEATKPGGWGLYLVDRIADRWGVARNSLTRVWFEIDGVAV